MAVMQATTRIVARGTEPRRRAARSGTAGWVYSIGKVIVGAMFVLAALFPLAWMVIAGFKSKTEVIETPFQFFPEVWKWENYAQILADPTFLRTMLWTFFGAVLFTVLAASRSTRSPPTRSLGSTSAFKRAALGHRHHHDVHPGHDDPAHQLHRRHATVRCSTPSRVLVIPGARERRR